MTFFDARSTDGIPMCLLCNRRRQRINSLHPSRSSSCGECCCCGASTSCYGAGARQCDREPPSPDSGTRFAACLDPVLLLAIRWPCRSLLQGPGGQAPGQRRSTGSLARTALLSGAITTLIAFLCIESDRHRARPATLVAQARAVSGVIPRSAAARWSLAI